MLCGVGEVEEMVLFRTKKQIYNALVLDLPYLNYFSVIWQECSQCLRQTLERIQNYRMSCQDLRQPKSKYKFL